MLETKTHPACTIHKHGMLQPLWLDKEKKGIICKISPKSVDHRGLAGKTKKGEESTQILVHVGMRIVRSVLDSFESWESFVLKIC